MKRPMSLRRRILLGLGAVLIIGLATVMIVFSHNSACVAVEPPAAGTQTMRAVRLRCYGPPSVLRLEVVDKPAPGDDQVLVKVHAAAANPLDWHGMRGEPYFIRFSSGFGLPSDPTLGEDYAGVVEAVGRNVTRFKPGDRVFGGRSGAFGEYLLVNHERSIVHIPDNATFEDAAAVNVGGITALQGLRDHGQLKAGQKVLINGASGGVGTYAVQIAKAMGAEVTAVCSTRNVEMVRSLGADHVVDYTRENFTDRADKYDLILDNVSTQPISEMRRVMKPGSRLVIVGGTSREPWIGVMWPIIRVAFVSMFVDESMGFFVANPRQADLQHLASLMREGKLRSVIDRRYPLHQTAAAIEYLETGRARGKVIVTVAE